MKGQMKNAIAEVSGRIPDGYQLTSQEILELAATFDNISLLLDEEEAE